MNGAPEKPLMIGGMEVSARAGLAPMAGCTDLAFREVCMSFGAAFCCTEMVSAKALCFGDKKSAELLASSDLCKPCAVQIFGSEPDTMAAGAVLALEMSNAPAIDINMGCPMPKITSNGEGSALMSDLPLASKVISAVKGAVNVPVTVKFRSGRTEKTINAVEFARMAESSGADALCIHGRTASQLYSGFADRNIIAAVKRAVTVPVTANGDVCSPESALSMLSDTGADAVSVGRASLGRPWLFAEIRAAFEGRDIPSPPPLNERLSVMRAQIRRAAELKGEHIAMLEARRHISWYIKGMPGAAAMRGRAVMLSTLDELDAFINEVANA